MVSSNQAAGIKMLANYGVNFTNETGTDWAKVAIDNNSDGVISVFLGLDSVNMQKELREIHRE